MRKNTETRSRELTTAAQSGQGPGRVITQLTLRPQNPIKPPFLRFYLMFFTKQLNNPIVVVGCKIGGTFKSCLSLVCVQCKDASHRSCGLLATQVSHD